MVYRPKHDALLKHDTLLEHDAIQEHDASSARTPSHPGLSTATTHSTNHATAHTITARLVAYNTLSSMQLSRHPLSCVKLA